jgi:plastocyanin
VRRPVVALAVLALLALAAAGASAAVSARSKTRVVKVGDDYFSAAKLTVKAGTRIRWSWLADNADSHDVRLKSGPRGVRKFHSELAASDFSYSQTLKKPGTYRIYCSIHALMRETIVVKR